MNSPSTLSQVQQVQLLLGTAIDQGVSFKKRFDALDSAEDIKRKSRKPWKYYGYPDNPCEEIGEIIAQEFSDVRLTDPDGETSYLEVIKAKAERRFNNYIAEPQATYEDVPMTVFQKAFMEHEDRRLQEFDHFYGNNVKWYTRIYLLLYADYVRRTLEMQETRLHGDARQAMTWACNLTTDDGRAFMELFLARDYKSLIYHYPTYYHYLIKS